MYPLPPAPRFRGDKFRRDAATTNHVIPAEASSDGTLQPQTTSFPRRQVRKRHGNHRPRHSRRSENEHIEGGNPFVRLSGSPPSSREERTCGDDWLLRPYSRSGCTRSPCSSLPPAPRFRGDKFRGGRLCSSLLASAGTSSAGASVMVPPCRALSYFVPLATFVGSALEG